MCIQPNNTITSSKHITNLKAHSNAPQARLFGPTKYWADFGFVCEHLWHLLCFFHIISRPYSLSIVYYAQMNYWLMKSEPDAYSIDDLERDGRTPWEGVRNYQARNFMRDDMAFGDVVFFYHSNVPAPGIVGEGTVCSEPYPDPTAFVPSDSHFDPKSSKDMPRWYLVDVCFHKRYRQSVLLSDLRGDPHLSSMKVAQKGNRLSITPVGPEEAKLIRARALW